MNKRTLEDVEITPGQRVLVRVDFNVPLKEGRITDDTRIRAALPTIHHLIEKGGRVVLMSHLGRPKGKADPALRLEPVSRRLSELLGKPVRQAPDCVGPEVEAQVEALKPGEVLLLENVRFHPEEEENDSAFAARLARLGDLFVNDAFGSAHNTDASVEGVAHHLPSAAGILLAKELDTLGRALEQPREGFVAILGGSKVEDKLGVIRNLLPRVERLLVGGGMAFTFLKARGYEIGRSLLDADFLEQAKALLDSPEGGRIELPTDVVVTDDLKNPTTHRVVSAREIPPDMLGVDIGPETTRRYQELLRNPRNVIWNGPMGVFENPDFAKGTRALAETLAERAKGGANVIIGGGDSAAAVTQMGLADGMVISTGGGASLKFLEGTVLPAVRALQERSEER
jgi:phosphoglycerate kinase